MNPSQTTAGPAPAPSLARPKSYARHTLSAWLAPDLALTFALATMLSLFLMLGGATRLFLDTDTGWHIRNGERILSSGRLPHIDPYSFSEAGHSWIAWEWGADVLMGAVNSLSGLAGIALMFGMVIGACVWLWFRLNRALGGNVLIAGLLFLPMAMTTELHWLARPHLFSWLFLLGSVWFCERIPRHLEWWHFALVFMGTGIWANFHASFFFAPVIAFIYAAGAYLKPLLWEERRSRARAATNPGWNYVAIGLAAILGTFVNPNGWQLHRHVISYLSNSELMSRISEFQSFNFHQGGALWVTLVLGVCFAGAFAALAVRKPERFLLSIFVIVIALRSVRTLPLAALLLLPLANGSIVEVLSQASGLAAGLRRRLDDALDYGDRLQALERLFHGFAIVPVAAVLIFLSIRASASFPPNTSPVMASEKVASLPPDARILSSDVFGGYLIYRFSGERKVFFDGRSDFYGTDFLRRYSKMMEARPGWQEEFNRWSFSHALLPADSPLIPALEDKGWKELYRDGTATLLADSPSSR